MIAEGIVIALAAWRLALFLTDDLAADPLRKILRADGGSTPLTAWSKLWSCIRCMTFWTMLICAGLWQLSHLPVEGLAIWGAAQAIHDISQRTGI